MADKYFTNTESAQQIRDEEPLHQKNNNNGNQSHPFEQAIMPIDKYLTKITQAVKPRKLSEYVYTVAI